MKQKPKTKTISRFSIRWDIEVYTAMQTAADNDMRLLPNWIKTVIVEKLKQEGLI